MKKRKKVFGWRRCYGYCVYIEQDGYIRRYFVEKDPKAVQMLLDRPLTVEGFKGRVWKHGTPIIEAPDYEGEVM